MPSSCVLRYFTSLINKLYSLRKLGFALAESSFRIEGIFLCVGVECRSLFFRVDVLVETHTQMECLLKTCLLIYLPRRVSVGPRELLRCSTQTLQLWRVGLVALQHMGSSFPNQGSNLHLLPCKVDSEPLDHQGIAV